MFYENTSLVGPMPVTDASRNVRKSSGYHVPANFKPATMDDLPIPSGSWKSDYDAKQSKYNKQLIIGTGFFVVTLVVAKASGMFNGYTDVPPYPYPNKE